MITNVSYVHVCMATNKKSCKFAAQHKNATNKQKYIEHDLNIDFKM
jgi:hypothetical protein